MSDEPYAYLEITLHMEGGVLVTAAVEEYSVVKNPIYGGISKLNWTNTPFGDLPRLNHVALDRILAITHRGTEVTR